MVSHGPDRQHPRASLRLCDATRGSSERAREARDAARILVKRSLELRDAADVAIREAEVAVYALRSTMRQFTCGGDRQRITHSERV
jgi:hypothetical protein